MVYRYTVMMEIVDRMSETGISGPYPQLDTDDLEHANAEIDFLNLNKFYHAYLRTNDVKGVPRGKRNV